MSNGSQQSFLPPQLATVLLVFMMSTMLLVVRLEAQPFGFDDFQISNPTSTPGDPATFSTIPKIVYVPESHRYLVVFFSDIDDGGPPQLWCQAVDGYTGELIDDPQHLTQGFVGINGVVTAFDPLLERMGVAFQAVHPNGFDGVEIFYRGVDADCTPRGSTAQVSLAGGPFNSDYRANNARIAFNPKRGEFLIIYRADDNEEGQAREEFEVFGRRVLSATGLTIGEDRRMTAVGGLGDQTREVSGLDLAWDSRLEEFQMLYVATNLLEETIEVQRVNGLGTPEGPSHTVHDCTEVPVDCHLAQMAYDRSTGQFLVGWYNAAPQVAVRLFDPFSGPVGTWQVVSELGPQFAVDHGARNFSFASAADGIFPIAFDARFELPGQDDDREIFVQLIDTNGEPTLESPVLLSAIGVPFDDESRAESISAALASDGTMLTVWSGDPYPGDEEIYGQLYRIYEIESLFSDGFETGTTERWTGVAPVRRAQ